MRVNSGPRKVFFIVGVGVAFRRFSVADSRGPENFLSRQRYLKLRKPKGSLKVARYECEFEMGQNHRGSISRTLRGGGGKWNVIKLPFGEVKPDGILGKVSRRPRFPTVKISDAVDVPNSTYLQSHTATYDADDSLLHSPSIFMNGVSIGGCGETRHLAEPTQGRGQVNPGRSWSAHEGGFGRRPSGSA